MISSKDDSEPDFMYGGRSSDRPCPPGYESPASRRALYQVKGKADREKRIESLQAQIESLRNPPGCDYCVDLPHGARDFKGVDVQKFGMIYDHPDLDVCVCPKCARVMAAWE